MNTRNAIKKSNSATSTEDMGMMRRGKYIFLMMLAFVTILLPALASPVEKIFQITKPQRANNGYGMPRSLLAEISLPKPKVNSAVITRGCKMAHKNPSTVCLYFTLISRHVKK